MKPLACLSQVRWLTWQDKVAYLAWKFKAIETSIDPVKHRFEDGWYVRTMRLPVGVVFVGRAHLEGHLVKLLSGKVMVVSEIGQRYFEAPATMQTIQGYQMVLYTLSDVVGETWHANPDDLRDLKQLEDSIFAPAEPVLERGRLVAESIAERFIA